MRIKNFLKYLGLCLFFACFVQQMQAQIVNEQPVDSLNQDTSLKKVRSSFKATLYSSVLPGAGQIYNRKYWKAPIVWAGMGSMAYLAVGNQNQFNRYRKAYLLRQDGGVDEFADIFNDEALINEMDRFQRNRDLCLIGATLIYIIQIVDASVDASLSDFDVSDDISMRFSTPLINPSTSNLGPVVPIGMTVSLKF